MNYKSYVPQRRDLSAKTGCLYIILFTRTTPVFNVSSINVSVCVRVWFSGKLLQRHRSSLRT